MLPFQATDPNAVVTSGRHQRLLSSKLNSNDHEDIGFGDNQFYLLPSCSGYEQFRAAGWAGYPPGTFYNSIRIKCFGDRFAKQYRVPQQNALTDAYWKLYNALCPNKKIEGTELGKIKKEGFDAGIDNRCLLNVVRVTPKGLSKLRWLDAAAERPGTDMSTLTRKRLLTSILEAISQVYANTNQQVLGIELNRAVLLKLGVSFNGDIAQYNYVMPEYTGQGLVMSDLTNAIPGFTPQALDEQREYGSTLDKLPELTQIPALMENSNAVELLGLPRDRLTAQRTQVPGAVLGGAPAPGGAPAGQAYGVGAGVPAGYQAGQYPPIAGALPIAPPAGQYQPPVGAPPVTPPGFQAPVGAPPIAPPPAGQYQPPVGAPPIAPPAGQFQPPAGLPPVAPPPVSSMTSNSAAAASAAFSANLQAAKNAAQAAQAGGVPPAPPATTGQF
jgi:hypothetical protein